MPEVFTDKMPGNIHNLGVISMMFPNARIIRMRRDALDTCVSCFLGRFGNGHPYTRRFDWLAASWRAHQRAGDLLIPRLPNPVLEVHYEDLARRPEREIRRMLDFLGLSWEAACLEPHGSDSTVTTRSQAQVRQAITDRSVGRWRRYGEKVRPLAEALGVEISEAEAA